MTIQLYRLSLNLLKLCIVYKTTNEPFNDKKNKNKHTLMSEIIFLHIYYTK